MTWLAFVFALEAGFAQQQLVLFSVPALGPLDASYNTSSPYTTLEASVELLGFLDIGGGATIFMANTETYMYAPFDSRFAFHVKARHSFLTLGWEHECFHPILSGRRPAVGYLYGGGNRFFLRLEGKVGGK